ncbi:MAG: hypothetical protein ACP5U2_14915, partial [Bryobacteraceae bacterium]
MSDSNSGLSRREFLVREAGLAAFACATAGRVLGANDRISIAFIGCGMQFLSLVEMFKRRREQRNDVHFSAVCDVWQPRLDNGLKVSGAERAYRDYREVL